MAVIDERLLDCQSIPENTENFNRVMAFIDGIGANLESLANAVKVTVTFDSVGGSSVESQTIKYNTTATEPDNPTKDDYTFAGWFIEDEEYDFDTLVVEDITLTAHWDAVEGE